MGKLLTGLLLLVSVCSTTMVDGTTKTHSVEYVVASNLLERVNFELQNHDLDFEVLPDDSKASLDFYAIQKDHAWRKVTELKKMEVPASKKKEFEDVINTMTDAFVSEANEAASCQKIIAVQDKTPYIKKYVEFKNERAEKLNHAKYKLEQLQKELK